MTNKERVHAALEGRPVDRYPVTAAYNHLVYADHFSELTGEPPWRLEAWRHAEPDEHLRLYRRMFSAVPFELLQPETAPSRELRERLEFVEKDGIPFRHDRRTHDWTPLNVPTRSGHPVDYTVNQRQTVFDKDDVRAQVRVGTAEQAIAAGANDYLGAVVAEFGETEFILSGGIVGPVYLCHAYVGLANLLAMLVEQPDLVEYLTAKLMEQDLKEIHRLAAAGGDAIFLDDALVTSEVISVAHYERFALPYTKALVEEIHRVDHKAILIYYGGIADRLEQIASVGADGLIMETTMKSYVNDIDATVEAIGDRVTVFANIDPVGCLQNGTEQEVAAEIRRQCAAGRRGRGFVANIASPITPATSVARMQRFLELGKEIGAEAADGRHTHPSIAP
jgi:uroporphyrinogen-III decarboxylase